jgi:hypothetical protein
MGMRSSGTACDASGSAADRRHHASRLGVRGAPALHDRPAARRGRSTCSTRISTPESERLRGVVCQRSDSRASDACQKIRSSTNLSTADPATRRPSRAVPRSPPSPQVSRLALTTPGAQYWQRILGKPRGRHLRRFCLWRILPELPLRAGKLSLGHRRKQGPEDRLERRTEHRDPARDPGRKTSSGRTRLGPAERRRWQRLIRAGDEVQIAGDYTASPAPQPSRASAVRTLVARLVCEGRRGSRPKCKSRSAPECARQSSAREVKGTR